MRKFKDKVAVVTGASNGIGYGIAERCALEGMKIVLAGINYENLQQAEKKLQHREAKTICIKTDVSKQHDIEKLAQETLETFNQVHLLVNNAGVGSGGTVWGSTYADWKWVLDVNLWGVIYGCKEFLPIMLEQNTEGHVVNTSSIAGLLPYHELAPYQVSKAAVVALSENLYHSLKERDSKVNVSVLCPGWVNTRIVDSERNRPLELRNEAYNVDREFMEYARKAAMAGMSVQDVAEHVFKAIKDERLYVLTHREYDSILQKRFKEILG